MIAFWKFLIIGVMVLFFPAAAFVAVKGFADLLLMFKDLRDGEETPPQE